MVKKDNFKKSTYELIEKKDNVKHIINEKISSAYELLKKPINSQDVLKQVRKEHTTWKDYIKEYLTRIFSDETISQEFIKSSCMSLSMRPSLEQLINDFKDSFEREINYLESLINRIDLIPEKMRIPVKMITNSDFHLISDSGVFDHPVDSRWHYL